MADGYEFGSAGAGVDGSSGGADDAGSGSPAFFLGGGSGDGSGSGDDSRDAAGNEFDDNIHVGRDKLNADGTFRKKRGRRSAGSGGKRASRSSADYSASVDSLARMLGYLHVGIAAASKTPELVITDDESKALAGATARVLEEFDIRPDPKVEAIVGLVTTAGAIYGPKAYFIRERRKREHEGN